MNTETVNPSLLPSPASMRVNPDRFGVVASVLCAVHCAVTPVIFVVLPTLGKVWAHPASHWAMALVVVPLAFWMVTRGYRRHRRRWVIATGVLGVLLILMGAAAPHLTGVFAGAEGAPCAMTCCPGFVGGSDDSRSFHFPLASVLSTAGGVFLIATHLGNLCGCHGGAGKCT